MRAKEFAQLNELNMAPGNLMKFAASPLAANMQAGFEAELIFPGEYDDSGGGDYDLDQDMTLHRNVDMSDIKDFFEIGRHDYGATSDIQSDYDDFTSEQWDDYFEEHIEEYEQAVRDAANEGEELDDDEVKDKATENCQEYFYSNDAPTLYDLFHYYDCNSYFDVYNRYSGSLTWPHMTSGGEFSEACGEYAQSLGQLVGARVEVSNEYHEQKKQPGVWYMEPDGSIRPEAGDRFGIEIVSPPMPVMDCLTNLKNVLTWAQEEGAETNKSTGLHVGISIAGMKASEVDYVKLALFLGDQYVLQSFGRAANTYTKSSALWIQMRAEDAAKFDQGLAAKLDDMKAGLITDVSKRIAQKNFDKFFSINAHDDYIEFRSMGGNYINQIDQIQNTILRYVRAYAVAADPTAERQEYAKKLTKILNPGRDDRLVPFVQFAMGSITKEDLINRLHVAMKQRAAMAVVQQPTQAAMSPQVPTDADPFAHARTLGPTGRAE